MAHKQFLHELLKEDQEPFKLKSYIADRRSQLNKSPTTTTTTLVHFNKRKPVIIAEKSTNRTNNLCKHACFFSIQNSPDVRKSPFVDFPSPAPKSPCKSPNGTVFLHIPSRTAALLVEAAMRIQKQQQSKSKSKAQSNTKTAGFGLFGSFLKRLKDRSKNKKRAIGNSNIENSGKSVPVEEAIRISCSCSVNWTESVEGKSLDFEASTNVSDYESSVGINSDFALLETRYCLSPFRFSLHKSPSSSGSRTPEFCSPAASPSRSVKEEKENSRNTDNVQGVDEEEKEQCSPVSVLDPPFEEDESREAEEDDYDLECNYANMQRAKQQLLNRLRRFELLAELDPMELERKLLEGSDDDDNLGEREVSEDEDEPFSPYKKQSVDTFVTEVFNQTSLQYNSKKMSNDMKKLVSDLIIEEKSETICSGNKEVVLGRVGKRLDSWKEVEYDTIDMMIGLDLKRESEGWKKFPEQVEEIVVDIELSMYELLVEELSEEYFHHQECNLCV